MLLTYQNPIFEVEMMGIEVYWNPPSVNCEAGNIMLGTGVVTVS